MGFGFFKSKQILPGVRLNMSSSGPSVSFGPRGLKHTIGPRGSRTTLGLPGTGLRYTHHHKKKPKTSEPRPREQNAAPAPLPDQDGQDRKAFVKAVQAFQKGQNSACRKHLSGAGDRSDTFWLMALSFMKEDKFKEASWAFANALSRPDDIGRLFEECGVSLSGAYPITPEITANFEPEERSTLLLMTEACQAAGDITGAKEAIRRLIALDPQDHVATLSLSELLLEDPASTQLELQDVATRLKLITMQPETDWIAALMHARISGALHCSSEMSSSYEACLRNASLPDERMHPVRYEYAMQASALGDRTKARQLLSQIFSDDPQFEDVAHRLKVKDY